MWILSSWWRWLGTNPNSNKSKQHNLSYLTILIIINQHFLNFCSRMWKMHWKWEIKVNRINMKMIIWLLRRLIRLSISIIGVRGTGEAEFWQVWVDLIYVRTLFILMNRMAKKSYEMSSIDKELSSSKQIDFEHLKYKW